MQNRARILGNRYALSSYPSHIIVPMPALSPTMETGSISKWNIKEGDKFEAGTSLCDVETDKATVSFDAQEEGYLAKILITTGDIKVGQPLMVTVEDQSFVAAFANFTGEESIASAPSAPTPALVKDAPAVAAPTLSTAAAVSAPAAATGSRIFASPLAKKMIREAGDDLSRVSSVLGSSGGSGPNGRILAGDVVKAMAAPRSAAATTAAQPAKQTQPQQQNAVQQTQHHQQHHALPSGIFEDFIVSDSMRAVAERMTHAKKTIPHYFLSVELDLTALLSLRDTLNTVGSKSKKDADKESSGGGVGVLELILKASASAMKLVPDANASWHDSFIRRYDQVDINLFMSAAGRTVAPVLRDVGGRGLGSLNSQIATLEDTLLSSSNEFDEAVGTFAVHNLGIYGIRSAAPILLPPQGCALSLGTITESIVPTSNSKDGDNWKVAPIMIATLVCDHRVVDGAVSAQWLAAFKQFVENPATILM
jgi:pyruvate dehydrogenase E2 component (dihydrolipoamide acetyltransferase)